MELVPHRILVYSDFFGRDDKPSYSDLLSGLPKERALELIVHFNGQLHSNERSSEIQFELLNFFLSNQSNEIKALFSNAIKRNDNGKSRIAFFNNVSFLLTVQHILIRSDPNDREFTTEDELSLLKAFLLISEEWIQKSEELITDGKIDTELDFIKIFLPSQLPIHENKLFKDFRIQLLKAVYLFEYLQGEEAFNDIISEFYEKKSVNNWQEYLVKVLSLYIRDIKPPHTTTKLEIPDEAVQNFADSLCINGEVVVDDEDFTSLRNKPLFKTHDGNYLFLSFNFLIDKLYQGLLFDIYYTSDVAQKKFKSIPTYRSNLSYLFSEKYMLYSYAQRHLSKDCIQISEDDIPEQTPVKPDYYIRHKSKILIIEFKDILLSKNIKHSYSFEKIVDGVFEKLVESKDGKKGILQLIDNIAGLNSGAFDGIDDFNKDQAKYYPVLIVTDKSFEQLGINFLINKEFEKRISKNDELPKHRIKNPVIIVLDDLIKFQDLFSEGKLKLWTLIDQFNSHINGSDMLKRTSSFHEFLHEKASKLLKDSPKQLFTEIEKILNAYSESENYEG